MPFALLSFARACAAVLAAAVMSAAQAANFPLRPVRIVVGFAPGGSTDGVTREFARRLEAEIGQPAIVDNKPGAGQVVALQTVQNAAPDGYTLLMGTTSSFAVSPHLYKSLHADALKFVPVAPVASQANVLVAHPDFRIASINELLNAAKARKAPLNYGTYGAGTGAHLAMEMLKAQAGIQATHIGYRGDAPALMALKSKEVDIAVITMFSAMSRIQSGELLGIGVFQAKPDRSLPQLQTTEQAGYPEVDVPSWIGLFAPLGTPKAVTDKLEAAARAVVATPDFQSFVLARGNEPMSMSNAEFSRLIELQSRRLGQVIRSIKLQPE